jgi:hypothetical protein
LCQRRGHIKRCQFKQMVELACRAVFDLCNALPPVIPVICQHSLLPLSAAEHVHKAARVAQRIGNMFVCPRLYSCTAYRMSRLRYVVGGTCR